jgi:hypothetical protein
MKSLIDKLVRCPTCGAAPGSACVTRVLETEVARRASTHAARRAIVARMIAPWASFDDDMLPRSYLRRCDTINCLLSPA